MQNSFFEKIKQDRKISDWIEQGKTKGTDTHKNISNNTAEIISKDIKIVMAIFYYVQEARTKTEIVTQKHGRLYIFK